MGNLFKFTHPGELDVETYTGTFSVKVACMIIPKHRNNSVERWMRTVWNTSGKL